MLPGPFQGRLVDIEGTSPVAASETIWVTDRLDLTVVSRLSACAGVLVTDADAHGPALTTASVLGRPCVCIPRERLPEPGTWVEVDRSGALRGREA